MENNRTEEKRRISAAIALAIACVIESFAMWNLYSWYSFSAPLGTLFSFAFLIVIFFATVTLKEAVRDPFFYIMAAAAVIAGLNLLIIDSGKGAWLTAADVLLVAYISERMKLPRICIGFLLSYIGFYFFYWTYDVKGYFKGYNTNYGGLVLITGFVFAITAMLFFAEKLKETEKGGARFLYISILFMFAWGYNIIAWYRARCALLGLVVFAALMLVPMKVWKNKVFYTALTAVMTFGAIAVSLLYVWLGRFSDRFSIRIFYKDIISGRDAIWADLWNAFLKMPLTGIGSSYEINVDWMGGMFEVHNGLLDILIVHGVFVFAATLVLLIRSLLKLREKAGESIVAKSATAAVFALLAASFMENFFIVPPFLMCTLALIAIARSV